MKTLSKLQQLSFIIRREFLAISTSYAVLLVLMGGIFVYGLLYNYMYAPNIVTDVPVAVVDNSHSELSRDFIRWLDATDSVHRCPLQLHSTQPDNKTDKHKLFFFIYYFLHFKTTSTSLKVETLIPHDVQKSLDFPIHVRRPIRCCFAS